MILNFLNTSFPPWYPGPMATLIGPGYLFFQIMLLIGIIYGYSNFKKLSPGYRYLVIYLNLIFLSEIISKVIVMSGYSNHSLFNLLVPLQSIAYGFIFSHLLSDKATGLRSSVLTGFIYAGISITISYLSYTTKFSFPSINISLLSGLMVLGSLLLYFKLIQKPSETSLFAQSEFWFATGNLIFFAGSFLIFGLYDWILGHDGSPMPSWGGNLIYILNYLLYGSYLASIYLNARKASKLPFR